MLIVFNKRLIALNNRVGKFISRFIVRFNRCIELFYRLSEFIIRLVTLFNRVTIYVTLFMDSPSSLIGLLLG